MPALDLPALVGPLSDDEPSGPDLEYDAAFGALERAAQFKAEQQVGDTVVAAEEPDWREVKKLALGLFEQTRDLRVAAHLCKALLRTDGVPGFADGLGVVSGLLENLWPSLHPELDEDDDDDPTFRINSIQELCDPSTVLNSFRTTPLVSVRGLGAFSLRDVMIMQGELSPRDDEKPPDPATIDAAFMASELEELQATKRALTNGLESIKQIEATVREKATGGMTANLDPLAKLFIQMDRVVQAQLERRDAGGEAAVVENDADGGEAVDGGPASGGAPRAAAGPQRLAGEVSSRDDVARALDKIIMYYRKHEPSSPIPILLERCKRLVPMDFMQIIENMASDAVDQVERLRGPLPEDDDD